MEVTPQTDCPYCFRALDPHDDDPPYRTGVQCGECFTKYHRVCWERNGNQCMHCKSTSGYPIMLPPLMRQGSQPSSSNISRVTETEISKIDWRSLTYLFAALFFISALINVILVISR